MKKYTRVMTIAGSDSGGGAGIQADLKTFLANGCFGTSVITAITAQNTCGVSAIHPVPVDIIAAQLRDVLTDIGTDGVKIGMLHSNEVITSLATSFQELLPGDCPLVLDPVMVATSGDRLIEDDAVAALKEKLIPQATLITPNLPEAAVLLGEELASAEDVRQAAVSLGQRFATNVLVKGGHMPGEHLVDVLYVQDGRRLVSWENRRVDTSNSHGTGCTLSSAIAAWLARGMALEEAVDAGIRYLQRSLQSGAGYSLGHGSGPVDHGWNVS